MKFKLQLVFSFLISMGFSEVVSAQPFTNDHTLSEITSNYTYEKKTTQEAQVLDLEGIELIMSGDADWTVETQISTKGGSCLRSPELDREQEAFFDFTIEGPGLLVYDSRSSTRYELEFMTVFINGKAEQSNTGEREWATYAVKLNDGTNHVQFGFFTSSSFRSGLSAVWIDNIRIEEIVEGPPTNDGFLVPTLSIRLGKTPIDPDGGILRYRYEWSSDGDDPDIVVGPTIDLTSTVSDDPFEGITISPGETWTVKVTPRDLEGEEGEPMMGTFIIGQDMSVTFQGWVIE